MIKVLTPITDLDQLKVGSVIERQGTYIMVLKIRGKEILTSEHVLCSSVEESPKAIGARPELKRPLYIFNKQELIKYNCQKVTFK